MPSPLGPYPVGLGDIRLVAVQCPPKIECSLDERAHLRLGKIALFLNGWKDALPVDPIHESAIPQASIAKWRMPRR